MDRNNRPEKSSLKHLKESRKKDKYEEYIDLDIKNINNKKGSEYLRQGKKEEAIECFQLAIAEGCAMAKNNLRVVQNSSDQKKLKPSFSPQKPYLTPIKPKGCCNIM